MEFFCFWDDLQRTQSLIENSGQLSQGFIIYKTLESLSYNSPEQDQKKRVAKVTPADPKKNPKTLHKLTMADLETATLEIYENIGAAHLQKTPVERKNAGEMHMINLEYKPLSRPKNSGCFSLMLCCLKKPIERDTELHSLL